MNSTNQNPRSLRPVPQTLEIGHSTNDWIYFSFLHDTWLWICHSYPVLLPKNYPPSWIYFLEESRSFIPSWYVFCCEACVPLQGNPGVVASVGVTSQPPKLSVPTARHWHVLAFLRPFPFWCISLFSGAHRLKLWFSTPWMWSARWGRASSRFWQKQAKIYYHRLATTQGDVFPSPVSCVD